jgi:hypothetical protein
MIAAPALAADAPQQRCYPICCSHQIGWAAVDTTTSTTTLSETGCIQCIQSQEEGPDASDEQQYSHIAVVRAGDVVTTLADVSTGRICFALNGNWQQHQQLLHSHQLLPASTDNNSSSTGDSTMPVAAAAAAVPLRPLLTTSRGDAGSKAVVNFGAVPFKHMPPADDARFSGWQAVVERPEVASHWPAVTAPSVTEKSVSVVAPAAPAAVLPLLSLSLRSSPTTTNTTTANSGSSSCLTPPRSSAALNTAPVRADASSPPFIFRAASPAAAAPKLVAVREESLPESPVITPAAAPPEHAEEQQQQQEDAKQQQQEKPLATGDAPAAVLTGTLPVVDPVNWGFRFVAEPLMGVQYRVCLHFCLYLYRSILCIEV